MVAIPLLLSPCIHVYPFCNGINPVRSLQPYFASRPLSSSLLLPASQSSASGGNQQPSSLCYTRTASLQPCCHKPSFKPFSI